jgi:chemotaxis signal transduction protein
MVQQGAFCELVASFRVSPLPNAPHYLLGLTSLRGNLLPVYQLESLFGLAKCPARYALLIGKALTSAAVAMSGKPQQLDLASLEPADPPSDIPELLAKVVLQCFRHEARVWLVIDHARLFKLLASGHTGAGN